MTQHIETVAYAAFAENGNIRIWSQDPGLGSKVEPLVRLSDVQATLTAAEERGRSEERERIVEIVKRRMAVYQTKENTSDFLAEPTVNSWDQYRYTREAHEWLLDAITKEPTP